MTTVVLWAEQLEVSADFVRISSDANQILLHAVPAEYREGVSVPPAIREDAVMKPVYQVTSIAAARKAVQGLAGQVFASDREQSYGTTKYCDGYDTEGNVFQLAEG